MTPGSSVTYRVFQVSEESALTLLLQQKGTECMAATAGFLREGNPCQENIRVISGQLSLWKLSRQQIDQWLQEVHCKCPLPPSLIPLQFAWSSISCHWGQWSNPCVWDENKTKQTTNKTNKQKNPQPPKKSAKPQNKTTTKKPQTNQNPKQNKAENERKGKEKKSTNPVILHGATKGMWETSLQFLEAGWVG